MRLLAADLAPLGVDLDPAAAGLLAALADLVARWQRGLNLSGHRGTTAILRGLVEDAVLLHGAVRELAGRAPVEIADLGSGAGFPGLPFAILERGATVELVDARQRRHHFQRAACRELGLERVRARLGRIETLDPTVSDWVIAQAVAPIDQVIGWAADWVRVGGWLIVPCGADPPRPPTDDRWTNVGTHAYPTPPGVGPRTIWAAQRA